MKEFEINTIVKDVLVCLDENDTIVVEPKTEEKPEVVTDNDTLMLPQIIESKILFAAKNILLNAPDIAIGEGEDGIHKVTTQLDKEHNRLLITAPNDCIRLLSLKLSDWRQSITTYIEEGNPLVNRMICDIEGVCANPLYPYVIWSYTLNRYDAYGVSPHSTLEIFRYVPEPKFNEGNTKFKFPEKLYRALIYDVAGQTCLTLNSPRATNFQTIVNQLIWKQNN